MALDDGDRGRTRPDAGRARDPLRRYALGSVLVGLAVLALKLGAWVATGAVALWADALESLVNIAAALVAWRAIALASRPADAGHPYGHGKAEYLSAVVEGVLIVLAAASIVTEAAGDLADPARIGAPLSGLALPLAAGATVLNAAWGGWLLREGRRRRSPALEASGRHLMTDVASTAAVLAGLGLATLTGWAVLDPLIARGVAAVILTQGARLLRGAAGGLMDEAADAEMRARIRAAIEASGAGATQAHAIRTRVSGRHTFVDFHLIVPGAMTVAEAHRICDRIEAAVDEALPGEAVVAIHVEPEHEAVPRPAVTF
ncbi:MAG: cation diffusion facilitator family transporter [Paracoccaceae bacterium]